MAPHHRHPPRVTDAGLPGERTYLAWQRTGLGFAAIGALLVHAAGGLRRPLADLPGIFGLAVGAVILLRALLRYWSFAAAAEGEAGVPHPRMVASIAAATTLLGAGALLIVVLG